MSAQPSRPNPPDPVDAAVARSLGDLVRREVQQAKGGREALASEPATFRDFWVMLVLLTDVVLVVLWIPEPVIRQLESVRIGLLKDVVPWLATGVFVLGAAWFQEQMVREIRRRRAAISAHLFLAMMTLLHLPLTPVPLRVEPETAQLWIDGQKIPLGSGQAVMLPLRLYYLVELKERGVAPQQHALGLSTVLSAVFGGPRCHWALARSVHVSALEPGMSVRFERSGSDSYPPDFLKAGSLQLQSLQREEGNDRAVTLDAPDDLHAVEVDLPYGEYSIVASKDGCESSRVELHVSAAADRLDIPELKCPG